MRWLACKTMSLLSASNFLLSYFFFSSRRRHTRWTGDWSSDVCSSDLASRLHRSGRSPSAADSSRTLSSRLASFRAARSRTAALGRTERTNQGCCRTSARSEERRVGKESRTRWTPDNEKKKNKKRVING